MRRKRPAAVHAANLLGVGLWLLAWPADLGAKAGSRLEVGPFSKQQIHGALPRGWEPLTFEEIDRETSYELIEEDGVVVVRATSKAANSGLKRDILIDPKEYPIVEWRWKVANVLRKGDIARMDGDDYPARLYITFQYDSARVGLLDRLKYEAVRWMYGRYPPLGAINYVWDSKAPVGTVVPSTYMDQVMMFVVESGTPRLNTWITERRNVYQDYRQAFGEEPPQISGVVIMTDTDNTGESATAYYGDIVFYPASS